jgi:hypothetical protein
MVYCYKCFFACNAGAGQVLYFPLKRALHASMILSTPLFM